MALPTHLVVYIGIQSGCPVTYGRLAYAVDLELLRNSVFKSKAMKAFTVHHVVHNGLVEFSTLNGYLHGYLFFKGPGHKALFLHGSFIAGTLPRHYQGILNTGMYSWWYSPFSNTFTSTPKCTPR